MTSTRRVAQLVALLVGALLVSLLSAAPGFGVPARATERLVGAVGCSQTNDIFVGLGMLGAEGFWDRESVSGYGGGTVSEWSDPSSFYWAQFDAALARHPATTDVWVELCVRDPGSPVATPEQLAAGEAVVAEVARRAPGVTVYVSAMNDYEGVTCFLSGTAGPAVSRAIADHLVAARLAEAGPVVGPLGPDMVGEDNCHANDAGREFQANQLLSFFFGTTPPPPPQGEPPSGEAPVFGDIAGSVFEADIIWLAEQGITVGCNPPEGDLFCPYEHVSRGQMAAFLHRALPNLQPVRPRIDFVDDDGSSFEADIEWLYMVGVANGTGPTTFEPGADVTRAQMAAFLVRAMGYSGGAGTDWFVDDDDSVFEAEIDELATAGITTGCGVDLFCPSDPVTRAQMAAFLHRALGG